MKSNFKFKPRDYIVSGRVVVVIMKAHLVGYDINIETKGIARCNPEDEFNLEFGLKLASLRAKAKAAKLFKREILKYQNDLIEETSKTIRIANECDSIFIDLGVFQMNNDELDEKVKETIVKPKEEK